MGDSKLLEQNQPINSRLLAWSTWSRDWYWRCNGRSTS